MKLNNMLSYLLDLAKQENEPNRYAHSEEYDKLYDELDRKTMLVDELEDKLGCPLEVVGRALENGIYTKESELDKELELFAVRGIEQKGVSVISKFCSYAECDFTCYYKDYKKTWFLKKDKSE